MTLQSDQMVSDRSLQEIKMVSRIILVVALFIGLAQSPSHLAATVDHDPDSQREAIDAMSEEALTNLFLERLQSLGGAILTETVFNRPGIGKLLVGAISQRDYNMVQSGLMVFAFIVVIVNLLVDLTYCLFDPKVKYE